MKIKKYKTVRTTNSGLSHETLHGSKEKAMNSVIDQKNAEINTKEQELQQALEDVREIERLTEELAE